MDFIIPESVIGGDPVRVDGVDKVTGHARYGADQPVRGALHAFLAVSGIARGRVSAVDESRARALPGVVEIFTHRNVGDAVKPGRWFLHGGYMGSVVQPLGTDAVHYGGQILALTVAENFEAARDAALALEFGYDEQQPTASFDDPGARELDPTAMGEVNIDTGDVEAALADAPVTIDATYQTPAQHHNPMELFQMTCAWEGDRLTVWESAQNVRGFQHGLAKQLKVPAADIRVLSRLVGGAFGSRGELSQATALVAHAARALGRPVKLVVSRQHGFTLRTFRAETRHHLRLGATRDGRLTALSHDSWEIASRDEHFGIAGSEATARLYACPNIHTRVKNVEADRQAPGFMRAPPETPYLFAMESAMDELAYALRLDPVELRRRNNTMNEPVKGLPYTSRGLVRCLDEGARLFGWDGRSPEPGSMRDGDQLVGWGVASAFYPTQMGPADVRVSLMPDGRAVVEVGTHEIGTGIKTVLVQTVADRLGLRIEQVSAAVGDSDLPAAPLSAGSNSTATVCTVAAKACEQLRARLAKAAVTEGPLKGEAPVELSFRDGAVRAGAASEPLVDVIRRAGGGDRLVENATNVPHGFPPVVPPLLVRRGMPLIKGGAQLKDRMQFAFGAHFVEVRVDRATGEVRVPRMTGVFAAGRIMNPRTARSQLMGGQIWGLGHALLEETEIDHRTALYVNNDLAEYHIAVNADVARIETVMLPEEDRAINPLGIKGVGELGITGANAAIANAVFHATGVRVRDLPIRCDKLLASPFMA